MVIWIRGYIYPLFEQVTAMEVAIVTGRGIVAVAIVDKDARRGWK